jgi:hypothetical protein
METHNIIKIFAIVIVAVMAFSMLAAGLLYAKNDTSSGTDTTNNLPTPSATPFTYNVSFDANALKELGTIRLSANTALSDKQSIDAGVLNVAGVLKVNSQFRKTALDANDWYYIAEVSLKKNTAPIPVVQNLFDLNYFEQDKKSGFFAAKYITISAPSSVMLHNTDLNIDRNFSFDSQTLSALAGLNTSPGDRLGITGTVTIAGSAVTALSLVEEINKTQQPVFDTNQLVIDTNTLPKDKNSA